MVAGAHFPQTALVYLGEALLQKRYAFANQAAVDLDLALTRATCTDSADHSGPGGTSGSGDPFQVGPHATQPRGGIFELGQFHLQAGLMGLGPSGKYVQYQLTAIQDFALNDLLQVANLGRRQIVVEDDQRSLIGVGALADLLGLAGAHIEGRIDLVAALDDVIHHLGAGGLGQSLQLPQRIAQVDPRLGQDDADQHSLFRPHRQVCSNQFSQYLKPQEDKVLQPKYRNPDA